MSFEPKEPEETIISASPRSAIGRPPEPGVVSSTSKASGGDLISFVRQQLDEDERVWREAFGDPTELHLAEHYFGPGARALLERQLPEVEAKRRILDEIVDEANGLDASVDLDRRIGIRDVSAEPFLGDQLVKLFAQPYAGRPGWREEWRTER